MIIRPPSFKDKLILPDDPFMTAKYRRRESGRRPLEFLMNPYRFGGGSSGDADYNSVKLLAEFDGTNGQTTFTDFSSSPASLSSGNGAAVSTTRSMFGTGSLLLNGTNQSVGTTRQIGIGTNPFTAEAHIRPTAAQAGRIVGAQSSGSTNAVFFLRVNADGSVQMYLRNAAGIGTQNVLSAAGLVSMTDTAWYHLAGTRSAGGVYTVWLNGTSVATLTSTNTDPNQGGNNYGFGSQYASAEFYKGYIDNIRVTEGVCRYTGSFTPPTAAYPHSL